MKQMVMICLAVCCVLTASSGHYYEEYRVLNPHYS